MHRPRHHFFVVAGSIKWLQPFPVFIDERLFEVHTKLLIDTACRQYRTGQAIYQ